VGPKQAKQKLKQASKSLEPRFPTLPTGTRASDDLLGDATGVMTPRPAWEQKKRDSEQTKALVSTEFLSEKNRCLFMKTGRYILTSI